MNGQSCLETPRLMTIAECLADFQACDWVCRRPGVSADVIPVVNLRNIKNDHCLPAWKAKYVSHKIMIQICLNLSENSRIQIHLASLSSIWARD